MKGKLTRSLWPWKTRMHVSALFSEAICLVIAINGNMRRNFHPVYGSLCVVEFCEELLP